MSYTPGQKKWAKPKMAKYFAFNGLNNKSLVRKLARIKKNALLRPPVPPHAELLLLQ